MPQYKQQLSKVRQAAVDNMDVVKRKVGLEGVDVNLADIKFKL